MGFALAAVPALMAGTASAATAASAATGFAAASAGLGAAGSLISGFSQAGQLGYQAKVAENNAGLLRAQAQNTLQGGQREESSKRMQVGELIGQQKASQGANGADVNVGSTESVRASTQAVGDLDAMTIRSNAMRQAWGQNMEALNQEQQAKMDKRGAKFALASSFIGAASSIAGGLGKIAGMQGSNALAFGSGSLKGVTSNVGGLLDTPSYLANAAADMGG